MAAWLLYITVVAGAVMALASVAERGVRQMGGATRPVWLAAMVVSVLPAVDLAVAIATPGVPGAGFASSAVRDSPDAVLNRLLLLGWATTSVAFIAGLRLSARTLRRNAFSWRTTRVAGEPVLVSTDLGPALLDAGRPRIVVPSRVLEWEPRLQSLVIAHEREHVRARDPWLLLTGLGLLALVPWCLPLWWQFHRLREAIETDCDARVLSATGAAREYAGVLLALAGRRRRNPALLTALAPGVVEVERRIRRVLSYRPGPARRGARRVMAAALVTVVVACVLPRPRVPALGLERRLGPPANPEMFQAPPSARVFLGFREPDENRPDGPTP